MRETCQEYLRKNDPLFSFRRTGRSTRMLEYARHKALRGKNVVIAAPNMQSATMLFDAFVEMYPGISKRLRTERRVVVIGGGTVSFTSTQHENWDWRAWIFRGVKRETVTLIDHHAFEKEYGPILAEYHRWDVAATHREEG